MTETPSYKPLPVVPPIGSTFSLTSPRLGNESFLQGYALAIRSVPLNLVVPLRHQILRPLDRPEDTLVEADHSAIAIHLAAFIGNSVVGALSTVPDRFPEPPHHDGWRLRGLAISPEARGRGIASALLQRILEYAEDRRFGLVWAYTRPRAIGLHVRQGFEIIGNAFEYPGTGPHFLIRYRIHRSSEEHPDMVEKVTRQSFGSAAPQKAVPDIDSGNLEP